MWSPCTLQINWLVDRLNNSASWKETKLICLLCFCEAPLQQSSYVSHYLQGPEGSTDPITGNTKWQEIISVYPGVWGKIHTRYPVNWIIKYGWFHCDAASSLVLSNLGKKNSGYYLQPGQGSSFCICPEASWGRRHRDLNYCWALDFMSPQRCEEGRKTTSNKHWSWIKALISAVASFNCSPEEPLLERIWA